jgi:hypothetical protein
LVESRLPVPGFVAGPLDESFVRAEGDVFHNTNLVHTSFVVKDVYGIREVCWPRMPAVIGGDAVSGIGRMADCPMRGQCR